MESEAGRRLLLLFLKAPRPGQVKTRLAAAIGPAAAASVYRRLAEKVLAGTASASYRRRVLFTPAGGGDEVAAWLPGEALAPQEEGDLGARLQAAFAAAFAEGAGRVAVAGTDVPRLTSAHVEQAFVALDAHDVVLGPATDGGYYLLALRRPLPALFAGIPWSGPTVLAATLERARAAGARVHLLEPLRDVDTAEDLEAERPYLADFP